MARARKKRRGRWQSPWRRLRRWLLFGLAGILAFSVLLVAPLRWVDPLTTSFMLQHNWQALWSEERRPARQASVPWEGISPHAALAVIAAEDQRFPLHRGFDFRSMSDAIAEYRRGGRMRGASTISQQTAKNLYLWPRQSLFRKAVEAYFTVLLEALLPKRRILEIYLNHAQFGADIYGVEAASRTYFGKPAADLTPSEAALLASVLPNPVRFRVDAPSDHVRGRQAWIQRQMQQLGGTRYLERL